jgi:hypothetical protein
MAVSPRGVSASFRCGVVSLPIKWTPYLIIAVVPAFCKRVFRGCLFKSEDERVGSGTQRDGVVESLVQEVDRTVFIFVVFAFYAVQRRKTFTAKSAKNA